MDHRQRSGTLSDLERRRIENVDRLFASGRAGVPELLDELATPTWTLRRAVIGALGALGDEAVPALVKHLQQQRSDETVIAATVDALVASTGHHVESTLQPLAGSDDPAIVADVAQILGRRGRPAAVPLLSMLSEHPHDNVAVAAIEGLGRIGGRAAVESLVGAVRSGNFFRTFPAIDVLGRSGDPRAVAPLTALLGNRLYTLEAARALGRTGDKTAVVPLATLLASGSTADVRVAAVALSDLRARSEERFGMTAPVEEAFRRVVDRVATTRRLSQAAVGADAAERVAIAHLLGMMGEAAATPLLIEMLAGEPEVATAAREALKRGGRSSDVALGEALARADGPQRLEILPLVTRVTAVEAVVVCLGDDDPQVRAAACEALARIGDQSVAERLFARLEDVSPSVVQAAVGAIQSLGSPETERLALQGARAASAGVRRWSLRILAYFGYPAAVNVCLESLRDPDPSVRESAIAGLPFLDEPRARDALLESVRGKDPRARAAAARALGQCAGDARAQAGLIRALGDEDPWVRYHACQSLGRLGVTAAVEPIARLLDDPAGQVRVAAVEGLSHFDSATAHEALSRAARATDPDLRRAALVGLGMTRRPEVLPVLAEALSAAQLPTRVVALGALANLPTSDVVPLLAQAAADPDTAIRNAAVAYLAARSEREAAVALLEVARRDPTNSSRALEALAVPSVARVRTLGELLVDADDVTAPLIASALVRMQDRTSSRALVAGLGLPNVAARKAVAATLGGLGTPESIRALQHAATTDADPEVRRICAVVLG